MIYSIVVILLIGGLALLGWYVLAAPSSQILCRALRSGPRNENLVALTFDDGPGPQTAAILDVLKANRVPATFFLCGANAKKFPDLVRRIAAEGHRIGNHAYSHEHFLGKTGSWMEEEIVSTDAVLAAILGEPSGENSPLDRTLFRPPYGLRWLGLASILKRLRKQAVMWNVSSEDWKRSPEEIVALVIARTQPGAIILLHDGVPPNETTDRISTLQALPEILYKLSPRYRFCTVDELARQASL